MFVSDDCLLMTIVIQNENGGFCFFKQQVGNKSCFLAGSNGTISSLQWTLIYCVIFIFFILHVPSCSKVGKCSPLFLKFKLCFI